MSLLIVWTAIQVVGAVLIAYGLRRAFTAQKLAAARAAAARAANEERTPAYERGLLDFYRLSGALTTFVGVILVVVPLVAR
ncbi:MAG: hypothetical protein NVS2B17_26370 [Candidatus Velthaea sp.]